MKITSSFTFFACTPYFGMNSLTSQFSGKPVVGQLADFSFAEIFTQKWAQAINPRANV